MELFTKIRDKFKPINGIVKYLKSIWFPITYAILTVLASSFGVFFYAPIMYIFLAFMALIVFFCDDFKVVLVPLLFSYMAVGNDGIASHSNAEDNAILNFCTPGLVQMLICGVGMFILLIVRFVMDGSFKRIFKDPSGLVIGLIAFAAAMVLNGIFSATYNAMDFLYGVVEGACLLIAFYIVYSGIAKSKDTLIYLSKLGLICGLMVGAEVLLLLLKLNMEGLLTVSNGIINKNNLVLGWGISTIIASVFVVTIPLTMYLAYKCKYGVFAYIAALVQYAFTFVLNCRAAILAGGLMLLVSIVLCCIFGKNRRMNIIAAGCLVAAGVITLIIYCNIKTLDAVGDWLYGFFRFNSVDSGRFKLWQNGLEDFLSAPVFGAGFTNGGYPPEQMHGNMFSNMYHNILVELIGAMGAFGAICFIVHISQVIMMTVRRFDAGRLIIMLGAVGLLAASLFDNFFFYPNMMLFYCAILAVCERSYKERAVKPDVLLTEKVNA